MHELLINWLTKQGIASEWLMSASAVTGLLCIIVIAVISHYIAKHQLLILVHNMVLRSSNHYDDLLIEHKFFSRVASLVPSVLLLFLTPYFLPMEYWLNHFLIIFAKVAICFQVAQSLSAALNVFKSLYKKTAREKYIPLNSTIQVIKLVIFIVATILAISYIIGRSPIYLLSGLGALTAVLILVFQDTVKGLVASIQISANRMVAPGDWVELPDYGADGDVLEIGLNTVKIQNFDKTVTTVPTYALINGSFKNWRDMLNSGGRRIKRAIIIDVSSIQFYQQTDIENLRSISLINSYLDKKQIEIAQWCQQRNIGDQYSVNARQMTNIGTFRAYIEAYLRSHHNVHQQMTCMVRQLAASENGLPLELYFFSNDQNWINYEGIQADIFDHLYAMAPQFGLKVFQHPSGHDWRESRS
jgi:miniconductance mechanosensitive channel